VTSEIHLPVFRTQQGSAMLSDKLMLAAYNAIPLAKPNTKLLCLTEHNAT